MITRFFLYLCRRKAQIVDFCLFEEIVSSDDNIIIYINAMKNSIENLYQLDGRVPLGKALPFGLQHVLAMFVSNITPIMILAAAVGLDSAVSAALVQNCMVIAGIGTDN